MVAARDPSPSVAVALKLTAPLMRLAGCAVITKLVVVGDEITYTPLALIAVNPLLLIESAANAIVLKVMFVKSWPPPPSMAGFI